jgi:D-3-phosphoglycerate dehydrogenase / 2-oxoglutarate reductase
VKVVVLDSLFRTLDVEAEAAAPLGGRVEAWSGDRAELASADVVAHVRTRVDAELIGAMRRCRVIARFGTGLDTVDLAAAEMAGISVLGVRDYCLPELASHTLLLAFALLRRLSETAGDLDLSWSGVAERTPVQRREEAVVVGFGSVGRRVAEALIALGYQVTVVTGHASKEALAAGAAVAPLDEALARGELVLMTCALTDETRGLIDEHRLAAMRPGAILVDTARLGLLDETAVAAALDAGTLGGLALDASLPATSPLRRFAGDARVLITPHIGWYSERSATELRRRTIAEALRLARQTDNLEVSTP